MFAHSLKCKSENYNFHCMTEDMASEPGVGFWIEETQIPQHHLDGFVKALEEWAIQQDFQYKIFLGNKCLSQS